MNVPRSPKTVSAIALTIMFLLLPFSRAGSGAQPATFVFGQAAEPDTLDMPISVNGQSGQVDTQIFNTLVRMKPGTVETEPDLATSWSVSPDGLVWTFKLRKGVTFQDNTPWNADAAKANFDRWADKNNPFHQKGATFIFWDFLMADAFKEAKAIDPETLQLVLRKPNGPFLTNLATITFDFASPESLKKYGGEGVGRNPVGTGPYRFVEWVRADHITLEANPGFFRKGLPKTARVVYRIITDNSARFLALKAHEIQAMELANPDDLKVARGDPGLKVGLRPALTTAWIQFGLNAPNSPFRDIKVRRAVALAINKAVIVHELYGDLGEVATQFMPPVAWGRDPKIKGYPYDPDGARKLLAEANHPNGFETDFWYLPVTRPYSPASKEIAQAIANDLARVGIRTRLMTEDFAAYLRDINTSTKFPIYMIGRTGDSGDPDDWFGPFFDHYNPNSARWSYDNPTVFQMVATARVLTNQALRAKVYRQIQDIIDHDVVQVPLAHGKSPILMVKNVEGLIPQPTSQEYMETVVLR